MAVKMRLRREGKRKQPFYRVVVADVRSPRDGRFIEDLGYYQPLSDPSAISIDRDRALHWLRNGVQPSDAVRNLLRIEGIWEDFKPGDPGRDRGNRPSPAPRAEAADGQQGGGGAPAERPVAPPEDPASEPEVLEPDEADEESTPERRTGESDTEPDSEDAAS